MSRYAIATGSIATCLALFAASPLHGDDWPQWRGPQRDGVWRETGIVEKFASDHLPIAWRAAIGPGYSGPTVAAGRVYITDRQTEPKQIERVLCFDEKTGKPLWHYEYGAEYKIGYTAGPRAAVTIDEGRAFALGAMGHFHCFDAATGKLLWKKDLAADYNVRMPIWGIAAAPLVEGQLVIVQIGGEHACIVALDKTTGKEQWKALDDRASYAAPIIVRQAGQRVLICWTGDSISALDPADGKLHWRLPFKPSKMVLNVATPVFSNRPNGNADRLFVTAFYDGATLAQLADDKFDATELWHKVGSSEEHTKAIQSIISTPVFDGDYIYGVDSYGQLRCLDAKTGERAWESLAAVPKARWSTIHFVKNGDRWFMFNERGELIIARLSPSGYDEISRTTLIEPTTDQLGQRHGVCWSHPAFANRHVFARNDKEIVCADLSAE
jgi:outer membrane protein assembly factor BamB